MNHIQNPKTKYGSATNSFNNFKSVKSEPRSFCNNPEKLMNETLTNDVHR